MALLALLDKLAVAPGVERVRGAACHRLLTDSRPPATLVPAIRWACVGTTTLIIGEATLAGQ